MSFRRLKFDEIPSFQIFLMVLCKQQIFLMFYANYACYWFMKN